MGPIKSRPFTFALHSLVGVGFLAGTFLVQPFLPEEDEQTKGSPSLETSALQILHKLRQHVFAIFFTNPTILVFNIQHKSSNDIKVKYLYHRPQPPLVPWLVPQFLPKKQRRSVAKKEGEVFSTGFSYVQPRFQYITARHCPTPCS